MSMKNRSITPLLAHYFIYGVLTTTVSAEPPTMKMTTPIPEGIETPDRLETHLGTLTAFDAVPDLETTQKIYDDLDLRRATDAFLAALPIASMAAMESGVRSFGPPNTTALLNVSGTEHNTIHRMDYGYWEEVNETIRAEPASGIDPEIRGLLASIGIEKGKPFSPDARMKEILTEAAKVGSVTARTWNFQVHEDQVHLRMSN